MARILIVEDDVGLAGVVTSLLNDANFETVHATHGETAWQLLIQQEFSLVLLDWELPDIAGIDLCNRYRASGGAVPVLMLTGKGRVQDKTEGLLTGADDYLAKPFDAAELLARIRALLRRGPSYVPSVLRGNGVELDPIIRKVTVHGKTVELTKKEFSLLEFLMRHPDQFFSTEELIVRVWESESLTSPDMVRTFVKKLRRKLDGDAEDSVISTVPNLGYSFRAERTTVT